MDYKKLASDVLKKVGGEENVSSVTHCITRLRFNLKDDNKAHTNEIKNLKGVVGVVNKGGQYQVIIGNEVTEVYKELVKLGNLNNESGSVKQDNSETSLVSKILDTIAGMFTPIIPVLAGAGMLKAIVAIAIAFKWMTPEMQIYQILNFMGDAGFYFLPVLLAATAAKKFNVNQPIAMVIGGILLHPNFISMVTTAKETGHGLDLFGIPIGLVSYSSTVVPIILAIWFMSYVEPFLNRIIPKTIRIFGVPLFTLLIVTLITLVALGPLGYYLGIGLGFIFTYLNSHVSWLVPTLVGAFTPLLVMIGMHYGLITIGINLLATKGFDPVAGPGMLVSNIAQGGAAMAVALRSKNTEIKSLASSTGIAAILGITEPALYGINLRYKKPLVASMIGGGVAGLFLGIMGVGRFVQIPPGLMSLPSYIGPNGFSILIYATIGCVIAFIVSFIVSYFLGIEEETKEQVSVETTKQESNSNVIYSPIKGNVVDLSVVNDGVFSQEILGKGVAIIPVEGKVFAPIDGTVTALLDSYHAIGITGDNGAEVLIHVGIDTVNLGGTHYSPYVSKGQQVKKGDLLLEFDIEAIKNEGYDVITPFIVTNTDKYSEVLAITDKDLHAGEAVIKLA